MQPVNISTTNFQAFAELAFQFKLTPTIAWQTTAFARPSCAAAAWCPIVHSSPTPAPSDQCRASHRQCGGLAWALAADA